ncbi:MAG TPA: exopolysaccharide biosynthesis protein [Atribacteraceae bacterium]|nr:exopolysaccharide biosynthesis protein [Atribacteraceae bacterium]
MLLIESQQTEGRTDTLGEKLKVLIGNLPPTGVTLAAIRDLVGQDGLLVLAAFLTIVFMVPISIPGVSTVFGAAILLIGISLLFDRNVWLPKRIAQRILSADKLRAAFSRGGTWLHVLERISRPHRLNWLVYTRLAQIVNSCAFIAGAVLLMLPSGLIPFSNTLPALALLFFSIGLLQRDGLCVLYGHLLNLATLIYFVFLVFGGGAAIREALRQLMN